MPIGEVLSALRMIFGALGMVWVLIGVVLKCVRMVFGVIL